MLGRHLGRKRSAIQSNVRSPSGIVGAMSTILPIGFLTISEAARSLELALFAGEPDRPEVEKARAKLGDAVGDGAASSNSVERVWRAVDDGFLRPLAVGGRPRRIVQIDPELTRSIPQMRHQSMPGFVYLRPSHPDWNEVTSWFGIDVSRIALAFRETEVKNVAARLSRSRRRKRPIRPGVKAGRHSMQPLIREAIVEIVARKQWSTMRAIKELAQLVNRLGKISRVVSEDSVRRALDGLYAATNNRRYERVHRRRTR
jgi:hypothetical protein